MHNAYHITYPQCGKKWNSLSPKNISWNQLFSTVFSKTVTFTKFLPKIMCEKIPLPWFPLWRVTYFLPWTFLSSKKVPLSTYPNGPALRPSLEDSIATGGCLGFATCTVGLGASVVGMLLGKLGNPLVLSEGWELKKLKELKLPPLFLLLLPELFWADCFCWFFFFFFFFFLRWDLGFLLRGAGVVVVVVEVVVLEAISKNLKQKRCNLTKQFAHFKKD